MKSRSYHPSRFSLCSSAEILGFLAVASGACGPHFHNAIIGQCRTGLQSSPCRPTSGFMDWKVKFGRIRRNPLVRLGLFALGILFLIITAIIGPLPGPGGVVTFAIGAGLILQNSIWARRRYVRLKKWQPKLGGWADWGLRRKSAKRRIERAKAKSEPETGAMN